MLSTEPIKLRKYSVEITAMIETILRQHTAFIPDDEDVEIPGKIILRNCSLEDIESSVTEQLVELANEVRNKPLSKLDTKTVYGGH